MGSLSAAVGSSGSPSLYKIVVAGDGSGTHVTLDGAIASAIDGDTIFIKDGDYTLSGTYIQKEVHLVGQSHSSRITVTSPVIFTGDNVTFRNLWIDVVLASSENGITFSGLAPEIIECKLTLSGANVNYKVFQFTNSNGLIRGCKYRCTQGNTTAGLLHTTSSAHNICVTKNTFTGTVAQVRFDGNNCIISDNSYTGDTGSFFRTPVLLNGTNHIVQNNTIMATGSTSILGLVAITSPNHTIDSNTLLNGATSSAANYIQVSSSGCLGLKIHNNRLVGKDGSEATAISLFVSGNTQSIQNNVISSVGKGVRFTGTDFVKSSVVGNNISNTVTPLEISGTISSDSVIANNTVS